MGGAPVGGAVPGGVAGPGAPWIPPGMPPGGGPPPQGRPPSKSGGLNRNVLGIAAAIALVAAYLGIAAVAHLSPFPAKNVAATSSESASQGNGGNPSSSGSPASSPAASSTSAVDTLLSKIPASVRGQHNCQDIGVADGATARVQCTGLKGPATAAIYYLFADSSALRNGFTSFLDSAGFNKAGAPKSCTTNGEFTKFVVQCKGDFTIASPAATGSVAEYVRINDFDPVIASTDDERLVMAVMVGTNQHDLLDYWQKLEWVVT
jgi:hypothetical protein